MLHRGDDVQGKRECHKELRNWLLAQSWSTSSEPWVGSIKVKLLYFFKAYLSHTTIREPGKRACPVL
jgi:hypothetical protein